MPSNNGRLAIGSPLSQKKNITQNKQHLKKKKSPLDQLTNCLIVLKKNQNIHHYFTEVTRRTGVLLNHIIYVSIQ